MLTKQKTLTLILTLIVSILWSNSGYAVEINKKINVVVSFSIIEDLTKQIGKEHVNVTSLIEREGEAHDFEPRAKHILLVKNAELFIFNGLNFEPWLDKFLAQNHFTKMKLNLGAALQLAPQDQNPHTWQNPELLLKYVEFIRDTLSQLRPEAKNIFMQNALNLTQDVRTIHNNYLSKINKLPKPRWLITPHNGFYHLAKTYGFEYIYLSSTGHNENLSAKTIKELIDQIKPLSNALLFNEWGSQSPLLATIQKETHKQIAGFLMGDSLTREDGLAANIQAYLKYNNEALIKAYNQ
jgi:zinc/manganese transport system substrate-binding protein